MSIFEKIYHKILDYAGHDKAPLFIYIYSFLEAIILPIPLDVFLGPIAMQKPKKWLELALVVTIFSILGGIVGYTIGYSLSDFARKFLNFISHPGTFEEIQQYVHKYGNLFIILVGFTPLPFKIFSLVFGISQIGILPFIIYSFISRLVRFILVSFLFAYYGNKYQKQIEIIISRTGWIIFAIAVVFLIWFGIKS